MAWIHLEKYCEATRNSGYHKSTEVQRNQEHLEEKSRERNVRLLKRELKKDREGSTRKN